jgi:hypothetical protein
MVFCLARLADGGFNSPAPWPFFLVKHRLKVRVHMHEMFTYQILFLQSFLVFYV